MMRIFKISTDYVNNWLMNETHNHMFYSKCLKKKVVYIGYIQ